VSGPYPKRHFDLISESLRAALRHAHQEAVRLNDSLIGTEHLLLGLMIGASQPVGAIFRLLDVEFQAILAAVEALPDREDSSAGSERRLTSAAMQALEQAIELYARFHLEEVSPLHLLIGILELPTCSAAKILERQKVNTADLHEALLRLYAPEEGELPTGPALDWLDTVREVAVRAEYAKSEHTESRAGLGWHAQLILRAADQTARLAGHHVPGTGHLLLALVDDAECIPGRVLQEAGLHPKRLELVIRTLLRENYRDPSATGSGMTPGLNETLHLAELEARALRSKASDHEHLQFAGRSLKRGSVNANHMLLGLLGMERGIARAVFDGYALDRLALRDRVLAETRPSTARHRRPFPPGSLWEWLNQQLIRRQWSLADLARESGIDRRRLRAWVRGERRPSATSCDALAAAFGSDPNTVRRLAGRPALIAPMPAAAEPPDAIDAMRGLFDQVHWDEGRIARMTALLRTMIKNDQDAQQEPHISN